MKKILIVHETLENRIGKKLQLKINDNRSTMLSVKWEPDCTKVSLHRMFLNAPQNIMDELACYLKGKQKKLAPSVKAYIEDNLQTLDYSHQLDVSKLETKGNVFNLNKIYRHLNRSYFDNALDLFITWFGNDQKKPGQKITFGLFNDILRLIKINRLLDHDYIPTYLIEYVIYHEMLHCVYPTYVDSKGMKHIHSKEFKEREKQFKYYQEARRWMKENEEFLFEN